MSKVALVCLRHGVQLALVLAIALTNAAFAGGSEVFKAASRSVVVVVAETADGTSQGSGVVFGPGVIVTNAHVVGDANDVLIRQGVEMWRGQVRNRNTTSDVAVIDILLTRAQSFNLPVAAKRPTSVIVGENVFAIGAPLGFERTMSDGIVSGLSVAIKTQLIQTTAPISPGSSGGGLFDARGKLVGLTTFTVRGSQALNFAIDLGELFLATLSDPDGFVADPVLPKSSRPRLPTRLKSIKCFNVYAGVGRSDQYERGELGISRAEFTTWLQQQLQRAGFDARLMGGEKTNDRNRLECSFFSVTAHASVEGEETHLVMKASLSEIVTFKDGSEGSILTWDDTLADELVPTMSLTQTFNERAGQFVPKLLTVTGH